MLTESEVVESATFTKTGKRWRARLIKAGWGAQMFYPAEVLERDGAKVFKAGTPVFFDHQTPEEKEFYQFGKVENFAGVLATDAMWDAEEQALFADIEFFEHQQPKVNGLAEHVGLSIRATTRSGLGNVGERNGRIANEILKARSVDFVVKAGAGGELIEALESATETENKETENMDEVLARLDAMGQEFNNKFTALDQRITEVQESLVAEETPVVETVDDPKPVTLTVDEAKILAKSGLSEAGIDSVLAKRTADQSLADLIEAEKTYVQESAVADSEGSIEDEGDETEESATRKPSELRLPAAWVVKESK